MKGTTVDKHYALRLSASHYKPLTWILINSVGSLKNKLTFYCRRSYMGSFVFKEKRFLLRSLVVMGEIFSCSVRTAGCGRWDPVPWPRLCLGNQESSHWPLQVPSWFFVSSFTFTCSLPAKTRIQKGEENTVQHRRLWWTPLSVSTAHASLPVRSQLWDDLR